jgi:hypothetical protein
LAVGTNLTNTSVCRRDLRATPVHCRWCRRRQVRFDDDSPADFSPILRDSRAIASLDRPPQTDDDVI